jgi:isopentenyldiphosphate isomerase
MLSTKSIEELVDVVDSDGRVIATVPRSVMRRQRLPHRAVYVLVFNSHGDILIHQRTHTKDVYPGYWDLCVGGVPQAGEDFDRAAYRETLEEIGVAATPHFLFDIQFADEHSIVHGRVYHAEHDGPFRFQQEEIISGNFVSPAALERLRGERPFCPDGWFVWETFRRSYHEADRKLIIGMGVRTHPNEGFRN